MRAISVKQPWAYAIAVGHKEVENRSRRTPWTSAVGEVIALHASAAPDESIQTRKHRVHGLYRGRRIGAPEAMAGAVLATVRLINVHRAFDGCCDPKYAEPDCWHLELDQLRPLSVPIPCRGALGLWRVPEEVERGIAFQLTTLEEAREDEPEVAQMVYGEMSLFGED